jgi:hypothetical protein
MPHDFIVIVIVLFDFVEILSIQAQCNSTLSVQALRIAPDFESHEYL